MDAIVETNMDSGSSQQLTIHTIGHSDHTIEAFLALGLSRGYQNEYWLLVIGVHGVPDYDLRIDYHNL